MTFNPGLSKQAQEVIFSKKTVKTSHSSFYYFYNVQVAPTRSQKYLVLYLDKKLRFNDFKNKQ